MKKYLVTGIIVWVPIAAVVFIVRFLLEAFDRILNILPVKYQPENMFGFDVPGFSLIILLLLLILTGFLARNWFGRTLINLSEKIVAKIPLVRSVYKGIKQSLTVILSNNSSSFREVVMLEYPRKGVWSIGFKTSSLTQEDGSNLIMVFIPTTPNPTSGFLVMVPNDAVKKLDMKVDEALKMIISLGTAQTKTDGVIS